MLRSVTRTIGFLAKLQRCPFPNLEETKQLFILRNTLKTRVRPQKETRKKKKKGFNIRFAEERSLLEKLK